MRALPGVQAHKCSGYLCLLLVFTMDVAGFALCRYSAWQHFETFSYAFAFPWLVWIVAIYVSTNTPGVLSYLIMSVNRGLSLRCLCETRNPFFDRIAMP